MIKEIKSKDIDREKWDALVSSDVSAKIYSLSWFLDAVTGNDWKAFVLNDYEAIMPFVTKKKMGIQYCYMPYFAQQFSVCGLGDVMVFLIELKKKYKYGHFSFSGVEETGLKNTYQRTNFVLPLSADYDTIYKSYSSKHQKKISKYFSEGLRYESSQNIEGLITLFQEEKKNVFSKKDMDQIVDNIKKIYTASLDEGSAELYDIISPEGIVGSALFLRAKDRIYYFLGAFKRDLDEYQGLSFCLFDSVIKKYASSSLVLDFEGSDHVGIARFFKGFGAENEPYSSIRWNDLPFYIKWIKH